jgi:DNA-binding NarL/FixJ family response regulator
MLLVCQAQPRTRCVGKNADAAALCSRRSAGLHSSFRCIRLQRNAWSASSRTGRQSGESNPRSRHHRAGDGSYIVHTQTKKLRLLLVDDHAVVREGLRSLLGTDQRFEVVGEAADGLTAVSAAEHLNPDVVVMDVSLPGLNGAQLARRLKETQPDVKTLALTVHEEGGYLRSLMDAGASGYVLKRSAASELLRAIEVVGEGGTYLDSSIAGQLVSKLGQRRPAIAPSSALSEREREVVRYVAHGYSNKEIAAKLDVSVKTVETYRYRATEKLGLHSRADLVRYAIDQGWLAES